MKARKYFYKEILSILLIVGLIYPNLFAFGQNTTKINQLQNQIDRQKSQIAELDKQIEKQRLEITKVQGEANTLNNAISVLEGTRKKIQTEINKTEAEIGRANLSIEQLGLQIEESENKIVLQREAIAESIRSRHKSESKSLVQQFMENDNLSDLWRNLDTLNMFSERLKEKTDEVEEFKKELAERQGEKQVEKNTLASLTVELSSQHQAVEANQQEKKTLLTKTKNKEAEYQKILQEKVRQKQAFEAELFNYQAQLKEALNPSDIPQQGALLSWPLERVVLTQRFGKTGDSGRLYASGTHNGIDMGTPTGTKVMAAAEGRVIGTGNTDAYPGCYSYGKWVLIEHSNGLSTLYAHLSAINVSSGQSVTRGQSIGLSGNTGYSTGPHLHMTLFASKGVQVSQYSQSNGCKQASIPLPTKTNAYLDPMAYLPVL